MKQPAVQPSPERPPRLGFVNRRVLNRTTRFSRWAKRRAPSAALLLVAAAASAANLSVIRLPAAAPVSVPAEIVAPAFPSVPAIPSALPASFVTARREISANGGNLPAAAPGVSAPERVSPQPATAGAAIAESKSVDEALTRLVASGALSADKVPQDPTDRLYLLKRLWDHAAPAYAEGKIAVDGGWAVPALRVEARGTTYLIHPVAHGQLYPPNKRAVSKLVRQIEARKEALYSEENLPAHYAFSYGRETADHGVDEGRPIAVEPAAQGLPAAGLKAFHAAVVAAALTPLALAAPQIAHDPSAMTIVPAALYLAFLALLRSGLLPVYRFLEWRRARQAAALGAVELAAQLRREAAALHKTRLDALEVLRLHLPPGVGAASDPFSKRSAAMAKAVADDTSAAGASVVHLLVGYKHAADIGWRLRSQLP